MSLWGDETDCFRMYSKRNHLLIIKNINDEILKVHIDGRTGPVAVFEHYLSPQSETDHDGINFCVVRYKTRVYNEMPKGIPIVFQITVNGLVYHMYSTEEGNRKVLKFKEGNAPISVEGSMKNIIFFQQYFDEQYYKFESASARGWFLCTANDNTVSLKEVERNDDEMIAVCLDKV
ncbi:interleukin-18-like [Pristis pectinata]|uniref:interleukin-18-like n=1 Tax=Pristis pectinata TaxID=685728 RepID=UPI00223E115E|nr:interleukin-18-like [Pristis pectinata]